LEKIVALLTRASKLAILGWCHDTKKVTCKTKSKEWMYMRMCLEPLKVQPLYSKGVVTWNRLTNGLAE
jgi:hypothetical protein